MSERTCCYCEKSDAVLRAEGKVDPVRPYGPGGAWVCYECAHSTPERRAVTEQGMGALLGAAEAASPQGFVVVGGDDAADGYRPGHLPPRVIGETHDER